MKEESGQTKRHAEATLIPLPSPLTPLFGYFTK